MPVPPASGGTCGAQSPAARTSSCSSREQRLAVGVLALDRALVREDALRHERLDLLEALGRRSPCGRRHGVSIARNAGSASTWATRQPGTNPLELLELARLAEGLGYDSAWAAEAWGVDAITPLAWLGAQTTTLKLGTAIMQLPGRSPANAAMTAATLDLLSGGRFLMGLGTSGPQVVEGWHGQEWGKPLGKTREYVEIVRAILRRERLEHHGEHYDIPVQGGTGLGKPLKLMARPLRSDIPIYLAAIGPKAVEQTFEIADGWLPIFWSPEKARDVFPLDRAREGFDIAPSVPALADRRRAGRARRAEGVLLVLHRRHGRAGQELLQRPLHALRLRSGGAEIQELFLGGQQREAAGKVPDAFVDEVALIGPVERIRDRLAAWRESGATTLLVSTRDEATLRAVAEAAS